MKKRIVALILAITIAFGCCLPAFAEDLNAEGSVPVKTEESVSDLPFVVVRGMDFKGLYYKLGTSEERNGIGKIDAGELIGILFKSIGKALIKSDWKIFADMVSEYAKNIFEFLTCDEKGESLYDISVKKYPLALSNYPEFKYCDDVDAMGVIKRGIELYGAENVYYYNYDWRLNPLTHADKINDLINQALSDSGKDKVNLVCSSMGGIETISYMYKYGTDKLNRVVFLSSTFTGTHVASDMLQGKIDINEYYLYAYLKKALAKDNKFLGFLFDSLYKTKVIKGICKLLNFTVMPNIKDEVYNVFLRKAFGTMPSLWALVLPEEYDACIKYMFGGKEEKYKDFISLTEEYQAMTAQRDNMLYKAVESGVSICVIAGYGSPCIPAYTGGGCNGDMILEADRMLGKAKVAPLGETLSDDSEAYLKNPKISPDNTVDLTDCLFPENTWAVKYARHVGCNYGSDMSDLLFAIVNFEGDASVTSIKEAYGFNQFEETTDGCNFVK